MDLRQKFERKPWFLPADERVSTCFKPSKLEFSVVNFDQHPVFIHFLGMQSGKHQTNTIRTLEVPLEILGPMKSWDLEGQQVINIVTHNEK